MNENDIGREIVDAAILVHREFGPGPLEAVYEIVLLDELRTRGMQAEHQVPVAINCRGIRFDPGFRADIHEGTRRLVEPQINVAFQDLTSFLTLSKSLS